MMQIEGVMEGLIILVRRRKVEESKTISWRDVKGHAESSG